MKNLIITALLTYLSISSTAQNLNNMQTIQQPITGNEQSNTDATPLNALIQFYDAFNHRKIDLMEQNWANDNTIAMDNPLGGIMRGWDNIKKVYLRIFDGKAKVYVEFYDYTIHQSNDFFYAVGRERGTFEIDGKSIELAIRTSRIFKRIDGQWRQVHHHGSIENPQLLRDYQQMVTN